MKILVVGDFHGKFPAKFKRLAKDVDLIISVGDYCPFSYRKLWFKHCYGKDVELWEVIGKKKTKELILKDLVAGEKVLKKLNSIGVPVISVVGNLDYVNLNDQYSEEVWTQKKGWKWYEQEFFSKMVKKYKNICRFDYGYLKINDLIFIGGFGGTSPGHVKSKAYKKYRRVLDNLFKKFNNENKNNKVFFVFHNMPYNCRLDKINIKTTNGKKIRGHYGSKLIRRIIDKYQPKLAIGGHIHENQGKCKIGKTTVLNSGAAVENEASIIDFNEESGKIRSIKFIKKSFK